MTLEQLLQENEDAAQYFAALPQRVRDSLRRCGDGICSLAALRERAQALVAKSGPPYATYALSGGESLNEEAQTTQPTEEGVVEMRKWSEFNTL